MNLKPIYDAAQAADAELNRVMDAMITAFGEGTEEGTQEALALRPTLDEAKAKAEQANTLYVEMRDAAATSDGAARNFVPVASVIPDKDVKKMSREVFFAMDASDQMKFIKGGGKIVDATVE